MQHLEGSGTPVLYIGRKVLKGCNDTDFKIMFWSSKLSDTPYNTNIQHVRYKTITLLEQNPHLHHHVCRVKALILHICFKVRSQLPIEI